MSSMSGCSEASHGVKGGAGHEQGLVPVAMPVMRERRFHQPSYDLQHGGPSLYGDVKPPPHANADFTCLSTSCRADGGKRVSACGKRRVAACSGSAYIHLKGTAPWCADQLKSHALDQINALSSSLPPSTTITSAPWRDRSIR